MTPPRTARERARAELTREITAEARRQLAEGGAGQLSLRAVARALGLASSALYRYFASRDELLTALIIDAYDSLGAAVEQAAAASGANARSRWLDCCAAVRDWARANPHEYALIYGSPVPGYAAPRDTVAPAARVAMAFGEILAGAAAAGELRGGGGPLPEPLAGQAAGLATMIAPGLAPEVLARTLVAWTQLFGMVSFELFGQLVGSADPADSFFSFAAAELADFVGLTGRQPAAAA